MKLLKVLRKESCLIRTILLISGMLVPLVLFFGCGGGGGGGGVATSGSSSGSTPQNSITDCYGCHADGLIAKYASENIFSAWRNGAHGNYEGTGLKGYPAYSDLSSGCLTCHDSRGDGEFLRAYYLSTGISFLGTEDRPLVGCESCHGSGANHFGFGPIPYPAPGPGICIGCHQTSNGFHGENGFDYINTTKINYDTHFDDSSTTDIEGYNMDIAGDRACLDCHNPHSVDTTINNEWANSSHGGYILQTIGSITPGSPTTANVTETEGPAFVHYDFKGTSRQACQRCHTATGFKNLADSPATYDPAKNDFTYLTGEQREMLYCWACHSSNVGDLRDPGAFANVAPYTGPAARINAVPDLNGSNLCMSCHSGRLNGQYIKDYGTISGKNFGTFNSHYLADGGILFRTIGYEFTGLDYSNVTGFAHASIGSTGGTDGDQGPCVACHMLTDDDHPNHKLEPVERDGSGLITDIKVFTKVCSGCHSEGEAALITTLNTRDTQYRAALYALQTQLESHGLYYGPAHPYFYSDTGLKTEYTDWMDKDTLGAAFNFNLLKNISVAYVHNREYTRRLIYDSIDFLDNGFFDKSVETTLGAGDAYDYLSGTR